MHIIRPAGQIRVTDAREFGRRATSASSFAYMASATVTSSVNKLNITEDVCDDKTRWCSPCELETFLFGTERSEPQTRETH